MERLKGHLLDWCDAKHTLPGQRQSGDKCLVAEFPAGALLAAVDGLGHGSEAASAARIAVDVLRHRAREPLTDLMSRCHEALRESRGVVMSLARYDVQGATLSWVGVGNVSGSLIRGGGGAGRRLLMRAGVVGAHLPPLHVLTFPVFAGDTLIMATDGIAGDFDHDLDARAPLRTLADRILAGYGRDTDDALVLVARFAGAGG